jgi:hypothetical protein
MTAAALAAAPVPMMATVGVAAVAMLTGSMALTTGGSALAAPAAISEAAAELPTSWRTSRRTARICARRAVGTQRRRIGARVDALALAISRHVGAQGRP